MEMLIVALVLVLFGAAWWRIFSKAGFHGVMGLLMIVPLVNLATILYFAAAEWPIQREVRGLRLSAKEEGDAFGGQGIRQ